MVKAKWSSRGPPTSVRVIICLSILNLFLRYYRIGSGESNVFVKSLFMVEIEELTCRDPFVKENFGGSFRCTLLCHDQCSSLDSK